jgi:hypothetical protein
MGAVLGWQALTVQANYGGNWTGLFRTGATMPVPEPLAASTLRNRHLESAPNAGYGAGAHAHVGIDEDQHVSRSMRGAEVPGRRRSPGLRWLEHHGTGRLGQSRRFVRGVVRREAFMLVGGFDESYTRPCIEDIELGYRLRPVRRSTRSTGGTDAGA